MTCQTNVPLQIATAALLLGAVAVPARGQGDPVVAVRVTIVAGHRLNIINPARDLGGALDGHDLGETSAIYTPFNIAAMKSAGLGPITYRLRTELGIETWHWNPAGRWSDAANQRGYWISDDHSSAPIDLTFGYRLPRRGRTIDDANNDGYSRIDDGDTLSFWKTNPYLDPRYTHDPESHHPQWFTVDLGTAVPLSEIQLAWGNPYPRRYDVDYWVGSQAEPIDYNPPGDWQRFEHGTVRDARGGRVTLRLTDRAVTTRFLRVTMYQSSHTADGGNGDPRDSLGFAVREVFAGDRDNAGTFHDAVRHDTLASRQSAILVSSTDPWHRAIDKDEETAQPGFDLIVRSGLTRRLPMLVPTGLLFDTPENAAAELRFLRSRGYPLQGVELGEEPDGQRVTPEDYAALYLQFAAALHAVDPRARLGGPSWQNLLNDPLYIWPTRTAPGKRDSWIGRFLDVLDAHQRIGDFRFLSFEWYPFDDVCVDPAANLAASPGMLVSDLQRLRAAGVPDSIPRVITEYGYSAHLSGAEVTLAGAVLDADVVGNFFAHGGSQAYFFGYEPGDLAHEPACPHWGNLVMFLADSIGKVKFRMPRYYTTWLLTHAWADSAGGAHTMLATQVTIAGSRTGDTLVSAYAMLRPDHRWSLLLVNRDAKQARTVDARMLASGQRAPRALRGPIDLWQYSAEQYQFAEDAEHGHPVRDLPPAHEVLWRPRHLTLPPYSITVVTGS